jgi:hypothetical protein
VLRINLLDKNSPVLRLERRKRLDRERVAAWRRANPERARETVRRNYAVASRRYHLNQYGITEYQFDFMWVVQKGKCGGCGEPLNPDGTAYVDHDHATGAIRGLLCRACNSALGLVKDSVATLQGLANYLGKKPFFEGRA